MRPPLRRAVIIKQEKIATMQQKKSGTMASNKILMLLEPVVVVVVVSMERNRMCAAAGRWAFGMGATVYAQLASLLGRRDGGGGPIAGLYKRTNAGMKPSVFQQTANCAVQFEQLICDTTEEEAKNKYVKMNSLQVGRVKRIHVIEVLLFEMDL